MCHLCVGMCITCVQVCVDVLVCYVCVCYLCSPLLQCSVWAWPQTVYEKEEVGRGKASDSRPLQRQKSAVVIDLLPHQRSSKVVRELTAQDDITGAEHLQPLQQLEQLPDAPVSVTPLVHHPVGPPLPLLGQSYSSLIPKDL